MFTLNKGQGQTLGAAMLNIRKPPLSVSLDPFAAYVTLSRSRGHETIRLLGDFEDHLFTSHPLEDLRKELVRLVEQMEQTMKLWDLGMYINILL